MTTTTTTTPIVIEDETKTESVDQTPMTRKFEDLAAKIAALERKQQIADDFNARCKKVESLMDQNRQSDNLLQAKQCVFNELNGNNDALKQILELKQREWVEIEQTTTISTTHSLGTTTTNQIDTSNQFSILIDESQM